MKRVVIGVVLSSLVVASWAVATDSEAQRRNRRQQQRAQEAPQSAAIEEALGELSWGMTNREVYNHFVQKIRAKYQERITKAPDAMREDRLRHAMNNEIQEIRRSYVRFNGQTTGWDVSFLRDEFTHGNSESMLMVRDSNSQNFYFFINDRLWKWYKAFDASVFAGQSFAQFAGALQGRFGEALERQGRLTERGTEKRWLEWQNDGTRLRAIDENRFYGFYCMVFESKEILNRLDQLRTNTINRREGGHALVDAVTSDDGEEATAANQDVVDRITGRIRRRTQAEESMDGNMGSSGRSRMQAPSRMTDIDDDDPLRGLDF